MLEWLDLLSALTPEQLVQLLVLLRRQHKLLIVEIVQLVEILLEADHARLAEKILRLGCQQ